MNLAYIAGPFRAKTLEGIIGNVRRALVCSELVNVAGKGDWFAHCPHVATYDLWQLMLEAGRAPLEQFWLDGDLLILKHAQLIVLTPGWFESTGSKTELNFAFDHGIEQLELYPETQLDSLSLKLKEIANAIHYKRRASSS